MRSDYPDHLLPPISCSECSLRLHTVYKPLMAATPDVVSALRHEVRSIPAGRTFMREGEIPKWVFSLYAGWAYRYKQLADGRRQILSFILPGDLLPLESLCFLNHPLPYSLKSLTSLSACVFAIEDMDRMLHATEEQIDALAQARYDYVSSTNERLLDLGRRTARGRIAGLLLEIHDRLEKRQMIENGSFDFPPRQEHLADALGLTTVYVNRTMVALRKDRVIEFGNQKMTILDIKELRRIASEE